MGLGWIIFYLFLAAFLISVVKPVRNIVLGFAILILGVTVVCVYHKELEDL